MISGAAQADAAVLMVPADGNFLISIQKGNPKKGEVQGQSRSHGRLLCLLGVEQLVVCVNKMDSELARYEEIRFKEISESVSAMLCKVGWKSDFVHYRIPFIPISGFVGENLLASSCKMPWWSGTSKKRLGNDKFVQLESLLEVLNVFFRVPKRNYTAFLRVPVSGCYKIKGVGDVITGRVEQGILNPGEEISFLPTHSGSNPCVGKVFSIEMHHVKTTSARAGDNIGINVKGLSKTNPPKAGDVIVLKSDTSLISPKTFIAHIQTLDNIPNSISPGYCPIGFVRCGRSACQLVNISWKIGKETSGKRYFNPDFLRSNEMAEATFKPCTPIVVEGYKSCEGLSRIAFLEGNTPLILGKIVCTGV